MANINNGKLGSFTVIVTMWLLDLQRLQYRSYYALQFDRCSNCIARRVFLRLVFLVTPLPYLEFGVLFQGMAQRILNIAKSRSFFSSVLEERVNLH